MDRDHDENVTAGPELRGKIPLISWVQAGNFAEATDLLNIGDAIEWVESSVQPHENTFALRVAGDSMEPDFPAGTVLIVEPDLEAHPGDYVIAKNGDQEATFKQLVKDGADWYLKPLNPRYPIKALTGCRIVGVVRAAERRFR
ncbi:LexA family protein [Niveibacterium terrae]|uniref:LexA family protein n=1 Tax=Niveibacterium terrae TaxID=3373598 RepID=UPI003A95C04B